LFALAAGCSSSSSERDTGCATSGSTSWAPPERDDGGTRDANAVVTLGERGQVEYRIYSSQCISGCSLDRQVLEGGMVTVQLTARGVTPTHVRLFPQGVASTATKPVVCETSTPTRRCTLIADLETELSGHVWLEALDEGGAEIDRATLHIARPSSLEVHVRAAERAPDGATRTLDVPRVDDVYVVPREATSVHLATTALGDDGVPMVWTRHGLTVTYDDPAVLRRDDDATSSGRTDVEDMLAGAAGETTVTVRARGAEQAVRFRVVR